MNGLVDDLIEAPFEKSVQGGEGERRLKVNPLSKRAAAWYHQISKEYLWPISLANIGSK